MLLGWHVKFDWQWGDFGGSKITGVTMPFFWTLCGQWARRKLRHFLSNREWNREMPFEEYGAWAAMGAVVKANGILESKWRLEKAGMRMSSSKLKGYLSIFNALNYWWVFKLMNFQSFEVLHYYIIEWISTLDCLESKNVNRLIRHKYLNRLGSRFCVNETSQIS